MSAEKIVKYGLKMRKHFDFSNFKPYNCFADHMYASMINMQLALKNVDCFIEVRDSRVPLSCINHEFHQKLVLKEKKPLIVVFSKNDLADWTHREKIIDYCYKRPEISQICFANLKKHRTTGIKNIVQAAKKAIYDVSTYQLSPFQELNAMVIGVPNVGKSSLINAARSKILHMDQVRKIGARPGVTKTISARIKVICC